MDGSITGYFVLRPNAGFTSYRHMPVCAFTAEHLPITADGVVGYRGDEALLRPDGQVVAGGELVVRDVETWLRCYRDSKTGVRPAIVPLPMTKGPTHGR